jgi:hypothetical protein
MPDKIAGLVEEQALAELDERPGVLQREGILELQAGQPGAGALDGENGVRLALDADADDRTLRVGEIGLAEPPPRIRLSAPAWTRDEELALDFHCHSNLPRGLAAPA